MLSCTKSDYDLAEYLSAVRDKKQRQILSKDRLTDHKLVTEKGKQEKLLPPIIEYVVTAWEVRARHFSS